MKSLNKRASYELRKSIYWGIALFVIVIVAFAYMWVIASYESRVTAVSPKLKAELIALRFTNIGDCFAYVDPFTERTYPGVIDVEKFTEERLFTCYHTDPEEGFKEYNFLLKLEQNNKSIKTNNYFQRDDFTLRKDVVVKEENNFRKDRLLIFVQGQ